MNKENSIDMYGLACELFPLCRSLTGKYNRMTLQRLQKILPSMKIYEVPTGTEVFDWTVPNEWEINDAYIEDMNGNRIVDFKVNNLHVLGYSAPINKVVSFEELKKMVYTLPEQPNFIPYVTSYYKERSGFCMSHSQLESLKDENYRVVIDSRLFKGSLSYGEVIIKGETEQEVFFSTYICHPSMANNEISGICMTTALAKLITEMPNRRYTYRIIFIPETIGAITYLSKNLEAMKKNIVAGFNVSCVGDNRIFSFLESRYGNTLADKVALHVLKHRYPNFKFYSYLQRNSDERQYCAPGVDLPVCTVMRSKYCEYPEYHTSADDLDFISSEGLNGSLSMYIDIIKLLENNYKYTLKCLCEPQLGKRGLYPTQSYKGSADNVRDMMNYIAYADGTMDLIEISEKIGCFGLNVIEIANKLLENELIGRVDE